jgi:hypothetical protein
MSQEIAKSPETGSPTNKKNKIRGILIVAAVLFLLPLALGLFVPVPGSAAWERKEDGSFDRVYGSSPLSIVMGVFAQSVAGGGVVQTHEKARQPMRLGSLTIVDVSNTPLSRRIAHKLASDARRLDGVTTVEVRIAGDQVDRQFIGDQLLFLRVDRSSVSRWLPINRSRVVVSADIGHVPEYGGLDDLETVQERVRAWSIELDGVYVGLPGGAPAKAANSIAERIALAKEWEEMGEFEEPVVQPPVNSSEALPCDLGSSSEVTAAMKLSSPPVLKGRRHERSGEAHWRYAAPDALDRLEAAVEQLQITGWKVVASNRGVDGRLHMARLTRGLEAVRFSSEKYSANPVVWVHYFNDSHGDRSPE